MKSAIPFFVFLLLAGTYTGCSDSTGQDADYVEQQVTFEQAEDDSRDDAQRERRDDDAWEEHRRNFGERRSSTRSDRDHDDDSWDHEDHARDYDDHSWDRDDHSWDKDKDCQDHKSHCKDHDFDFDFDFDFDNLEEFENSEDLEEAFSQLGEAFEEFGDAFSNESGVRSVNYNELKDVLPSRIRGFEKKNFNGENVEVMGFNISVLEQDYISDDNEPLSIKVIDLGSLANAATVGLDWMDIKIENESSTGFEKNNNY